MPLLHPSSTHCYSLKLPELPAHARHFDEVAKRRLTLDCRTGAASTIARSDLFVHGGLTMALNLERVDTVNLQQEIMMYFAKEKTCGKLFKNLSEWVSPELFALDLISRSWTRIKTVVEGNSNDDLYSTKSYTNDPSSKAITPKYPQLKSRLFHSMCYTNSSLYMFGGLIVSPESEYELIATNSLWKLDLKTKVWSLISEDPRITRRFNHSVHVKNENDETRDTKIVIVGGLNNMDEPISTIDIFNITKHCWEFELNPNVKDHMKTNIDGNDVSLTNNTSFSILVENNEANIPALAFYYPQNIFSDSANNRLDPFDPENSHKRINNTENQLSPYVALPLLPDSHGMRMDTASVQNQELLRVPFNLSHPTGDYYGYNIICAGFYPDCKPYNFHCYAYDIHTGKWTRINAYCNHRGMENHTHRYWKVFLWKSHHQSIFMGTNDPEDNLPSVQKFDSLLIINLPMINLYSKLGSGSRYSTMSLPASSPIGLNANDYSLHSITSDKLNSFRKPSYASTATSQFESYIRYIAPPVEFKAIPSAFQPYAKVLGKDAMEIFGSSLSDFEFITDDGESISVPIYLLRKRWGRYFDMLLSKSYTEVLAEYENAGTQSSIIKYSPKNSPYYPKNDRRNSDVSFTAPLDDPSNKGKSPMTPSSMFQKNLDLKPRRSVSSMGSGEHPLSHVVGGSFISNLCNTDDDVDDPVSSIRSLLKKKHYENINVKSLSKLELSSTTSSTSGLVFRVPFGEQSQVPKRNQSIQSIQSFQSNNSNQSAHSSQSSEKGNISANIKRRSSLAVSSNMDLLKSKKLDIPRRLSHPNPLFISQDNSVNFRNITNSHSSRNPSIASQGSSISFVSSSSDRMGNNMHASMGNITDSPSLGVLSIPLPPQLDAPNMALPHFPIYPNTFISRRNDSIADNYFSAASSPGISTSPPNFHRLSSPDIPFPLVDSIPKSLDNQLMQDKSLNPNLQVDITRPQFKSAFMKATYSRSRGSSISNPQLEARSPSITLSIASTGSAISNNVPELEPLLTPRSLYMPWSSATVRALTEFFYTGQDNPKWPLIPVVLNLFVLSKFYEIPLLNNMISELLYTVVDRKEESLFDMCNILLQVIRTSTLENSSNDSEKAKNNLENNENYNGLLKLKEALENIDTGFYDIGLVNRMSSIFSCSTNDSSDADCNRRNSSIGSFPNVAQPLFKGGPRDSFNSIGSIVLPPNIPPHGQRLSNFGLNGSKVKKSSILQNEINDHTLEESENDLNQESTITDIEASMKEVTLDEISEMNSHSNSQDKKTFDKKPENIEKLDLEDGTENSSDSSSSSLSDLDVFDSELGVLSASKMSKKISERENEESIDPLLGLCQVPSSNSPSRNINNDHQKNLSNSASVLNIPKDNCSKYDSPTIEDLLSPNALPPVDYVMKSIYRTSVLTNDIQLMARSLNCVNISRKLKKIRKNLNASNLNLLNIKKDEEGLKNLGSFWSNKTFQQRSNSSLGSNVANSSKPKSVSPRSSNINFSMTPSIPNGDGRASSLSIKQTQVPISPRTSVADIYNANSTGIPLKKFPTNPVSNLKRYNYQSSTVTTTPPQAQSSSSKQQQQSLSNNKTHVGVIDGDVPISKVQSEQLPQSYSAGKGKVDHLSTGGGSFSFFGIKK
ncbi:hypothetical protein Kpol_1031p43 [Vanderwaltozyma polyspora DSM 70294]|uniref:Attractin/MKLN-like beta-propeller domain-containing protein n=1 Tax=Vanderwaltozyma polyspora (strain ATCC 22028 / DSM 70294 / BCRC 21397 / CBS 2163 / NBRC 10782 / NRRL Y-8283 / UCD 57-17) TaxID=436907 RepID=A7THX5_VANPO|nr:uncharacterized protein Kpol_1031p43 [Vanderwaltozyma polyspora DSM 70294]EDO18137.1 hypothetical protein Kpol_1031p43 [Vanderwaltozyma polyspora DSM 70294]